MKSPSPRTRNRPTSATGTQTMVRRILVHQGAVAEALREVREAHHAGGEQRTAQQPEDETAAVRGKVSEQAPVGAPRAAAGGTLGTALAQRSVAVVQGLPAGASLMVAMLTSAKPRRPSTSMAVITD